MVTLNNSAPIGSAYQGTAAELNNSIKLSESKAKALFDNFNCCFLKSGKLAKVPDGGEGWQKKPRQFSEYKGQGIGIICGKSKDGLSVHALDVDTTFEPLADMVKEFLGQYIYEKDKCGFNIERIGLAPKFLIPFACDTELKKTSSKAFYPVGVDPESEEGKATKNQLEVLGVGNQFAAYQIHPDTGKPYQWFSDSSFIVDSLADIEPLDLIRFTPEDIEAFIAKFEYLADQVRLVDGGLYKKAKTAPLKPRNVSDKEDQGIIDLVVDACDMRTVLTKHYEPKGKGFLYPGSTTGIPGVYILTDETGRERAYSHHSGDPLSDGYAHDVFSVIVVKGYGGDIKKAVAELADQFDPEGQKERRRIFKQEEAEKQAQALLKAQNDEIEQNGWPELVSLDIEHADPLPFHLWPESVGSLIEGLAAETETPVDLTASLVLSAYSTAVQRLADVEVKPGYSEPLCLYTAAGLPPALRKSSVFKRVAKPFIQWESDKIDVMLPEIKKAESLAKTHTARMQKLRTEAAKAKDPEEAKALAEQLAKEEEAQPKIPSIPRVWTSDSTTEALANLMAENNETCSLMSAEGGIFETMAGRYANSVPNIDLYLMAHAGDSVRIDRSGKPPIILDNPRLSIALAVQPDVIQSLSTKPGFQGRGLLGRFLYVMPRSNLGERTGITEQLNPFSEISYVEQIKTLLDATHKAKTKNLAHSRVKLSADAFNVWFEFWKEIEKQLGYDGTFEHCTDWAGKLPGAVARIAGVFHFIRHGLEGISSTINVEDMTAAVETGRALSTHALQVYGLMKSDPEIESAKALLRWMRRHNKQDFTARDAHQAHKSRFLRVAELDKPLDILVERGYICPVLNEEKGKGRPSSTRFKVNPAIFV